MLPIQNYRSLSLSFERASTPGETQTGLGPRVYPFTTPGCCTAQISGCFSINFRHPKPSDLMLRLVPDVLSLIVQDPPGTVHPSL